jgi:hypothetical protein
MQTLKLNPQFINGTDGKPIGVYLTIEEFNNIIEDIEELADIETVEAYNQNPNKEVMPFEKALDEIKEERRELHHTD